MVKRGQVYNGEISDSDDDGEHSNAFEIYCDCSDSSVSSVSLEDLDGPDNDSEDEASSSDSSYSLPVAFGETERDEDDDDDDDDDEEEEDEDIQYIKSLYDSTRSGMSSKAEPLDGKAMELSKEENAKRNRERFKIRDSQVEKRKTEGSPEATASKAQSLPSASATSGPTPKRRRPRRRRRNNASSRSARSHDSHSTASLLSGDCSIDEDKPVVERRPSMGEMVLQDLADEGLTDDELEESLRHDYSTRSRMNGSQSSISSANRSKRAETSTPGHQSFQRNMDVSARTASSQSQRLDVSARTTSSRSRQRLDVSTRTTSSRSRQERIDMSFRSQGSQGVRSILSNGGGNDEGRPGTKRKPSMGQMLLHDLRDEGMNGDALEESLRKDFAPWQHRQTSSTSELSRSSRSRTLRGRRKPANLVLVDDDDDDEEETESSSSSSSSSSEDNSDCWSEALEAEDANKIFSKHLAAAANKASRKNSRIPNLRRDRFTKSQRALGISDHGTIHFDSAHGDDSSIEDSFCGDSSSIEYTSAESESDHGEEDDDEASNIDQTNRTSTARDKVLAQLSPVPPPGRLNRHSSMPDRALLDEEEAATMEGSVRTTTMHTHISQSHHTGSSDPSEVLMKRTQVRNNLQRLDGHLFKVFGESAPDLSESTRKLLRSSLTNGNGVPNASQNSRQSKHSHSISSHSTVSVTSNRSASQHSASLLSRSPMLANSKSTSSLMEKRSHADLKRKKLREAFGSLGLSSSRLS